MFINEVSDAGAGGEKVLWTAVAAVQKAGKLGKKEHPIKIYIYSGSLLQPQEILQKKVKDRFGITISQEGLEFVTIDAALHNSLDPSNYPRFTMVWQALAYISVCVRCVSMSPCDIFVDTMGVGFSYPFLKMLFGMQIYSYTHYPFISRDMVNTVQEGKQQYNNSVGGGAVAKNIKLVYYWVIYYMYRFCGKFADQVAANSSWTRGHMDELWEKGDKILTIYPPCDTSAFMENISLEKKRENLMISFAQFRPEKQHQL